MADNYVANAGSGGVTFASDEDVGTVHWPYVKLVFGAADTQTLVSTSNPIPVDLRTDNLAGNIDINLAASAATVTVDSELPAAAALADTTANPTVPGVGAFAEMYNGTTWDRVRGDTTNGLLVNLGANNDVTVTSGNITADTELPAAAALADNAANPTAPAVGAFGMWWDGVTWDRASGDATNGLLVNLGGNNDVTVTGTVSVSGTVTVDSELPAAAALADNAANPTAPAVGAFLMAWDGATWDRAPGTSADGMLVNLGTNNDVTVTGTVTVDLGANNDVVAAGDVAHDTADSGNPVKIGAVARTAHPTAVGGADRVNVYADDLGRLVVYPYAPRDLVTHNRLALTTTTETTLITAGGAGVFKDLTLLVMSNESATETRVDIRDSTTGTVRLSMDLAADGGGAVIKFDPPLTQATAANNWTAQLSGAVSTVYITAVAVDNN